MNRRLQDPFQSVELPEAIEEYLEHGSATCSAFNRRGTLLAVGTEEGQCVIWDFETHSVAKVVQAHRQAINGVAWSRNGRRVISGSSDKSVRSWDTLSGAEETSITLESAVLGISVDKNDSDVVLVTLQSGPPALVDLSGKSSGITSLGCLVKEAEGHRGKSDLPNTPSCAALFDKDSKKIFVGHPKGLITIYDRDLKVLDIVKVPQTNRILGMHLNRKGTLLLVNCSDRVIRLFNVEANFSPGGRLDEKACSEKLAGKSIPKSGSLLWEDPLLSLKNEFQNVIERTQWKCMAFSADSEYVSVGASSKSEHLLYIWSTVLGKLERILEGPKDGARFVTWHPLRSILLSIANSGKLFIWSKIYTENWSAFAPDFQELEENQEYVEAETEFDLNDMPARKLRRIEQAEGAGDDAMEEGGLSEASLSIDIFTVQEVPVFSSDDEVQGALHHLPVEMVGHEFPDVETLESRREPEPRLPPKKEAKSARATAHLHPGNGGRRRK
ncbi:hypothetical protein BSKO_07670 [Bryopsis sp. KO-2023]|nr:hypothetical protein BSKO_07670 [Bryopsis sp. KO-2023]